MTNNCTERNISLIENFGHSSHNEDRRQNIFLVVRKHRKLITKDMSLSELINLKPRVEKFLKDNGLLKDTIKGIFFFLKKK